MNEAFIWLTEKFLMARNFYRIFTENKPVMGDSKTFGIPEAKGLKKFCSHVKHHHLGLWTFQAHCGLSRIDTAFVNDVLFWGKGL